MKLSGIANIAGSGSLMESCHKHQKAVRRLAKRVFHAGGYSIRDTGRGVGGVDLLHDARVLLGQAARPLLFDVGANVGQTTLAMLDAFDSPRIRAFEPSPATAATLQRAVGSRQDVVVEPLAFGEADGELPFHVTEAFSVNDSLLRPRWNAGGTVIQVPVTSVNSYCEKHRIRGIDLLKIDTQGYDLRVLRGARDMLARRQIRLFCCEANFQELYEGQASLGDLLTFAAEAGYRLVGFYEQSYVKNELSYLDALFKAA